MTRTFLYNVYGDTPGQRQAFAYVPGACPVMAVQCEAYAAPLVRAYPVYRLRVRARMPAVFGKE